MYATTTALDVVMVGVNFDTATTTLADKAIQHAEAEVNKYLSKRYDVGGSPFDTTSSIPPIVRMLTERCAEGYMWQWLARGSKEGLERGRALVKEVQENLALIAGYKLDVLASSGAAVPDMSNTAYRVQCNTSTYVNTFNEDEETDWKVDSDKLTDIADERK